MSYRICSNACPLSWWCYITIWSSATPFSFAFSLSQPQDIFQWIGSLHQMAKVSELQLQHQPLQWIFALTFVSWVMSLLLNTLSRFVIPFLPWSNCLLISWLQSPSAVILESKKRKSVTVFLRFACLFAMKWWDQIPWS